MANKTVTVLLKAITGAYRAEMTKSALSTQQLAVAAGQGGRAQQFLTKALGPTGVAALKVAAGFAAAGGLTYAIVGSAKAAIDFESQFAGVRKTLGDLAERDLQALSGAFRTMATQIPASTQEINAVGEAAGQLGIKAEHVLSFTRVMIDLGNTTNLSADEAAQSLARLANITQMPQSQFDRLGATIVHLGNNMATTEQEISDMSLRIAGAGNVIGLTEAEILAFGSALSSVGIKAEAGGSAISRVFLTMQEAARGGGEQLESFAEVAGITATGFARQFSTAPAQAIQNFIEGLGRMNEEGNLTNEVFVELGLSEIRVRDALLRTAGAGDLVARNLELANEAWTENTALVKEAEQRYATTASKIEVAQNSIKDLGIEMGNTLLPAIGSVANALSDFLAGFSAREIEEGTNAMYFLGQSMRGAIHPTEDLAAKMQEVRSTTAVMESGLGDLATKLEVITGATDQNAQRTREMASNHLAAYSAIGTFRSSVEDTAVSVDRINQITIQAARFAGAHTEATEKQKDELALYDETAEEAANAMEELTERQQALQEAVMAFFDPMEAYNAALEKNEAKLRERGEAEAEATKTSKDSWEDFMGVVKVSGKDLIKELENQVKTYEDWEKNLVTIAKRGRGDLAAELAAMGPEGAALAKTFANMTDKEFQRAYKLWKKGHEQASDDNVRELESGLARASRTASTGARETANAANNQITGGVARFARIVDGYAGALQAGLNPIILSVGGKKIVLSATASRAYIQNKFNQASGDIMVRDRSKAHLTSQMSVVYGEPETGGEAYIPLSPAKRPRSRMIADETVRRLGGQVSWMAKGGFKSTSAVPKVPNMGPGVMAQAGEDAMSHTRKAAVDYVQKNLAPILGSGIGHKAMWAALHKRFPSAQLFSSFRPGAITATGNASYHGMGRAIDVSPWARIAEWIYENYKRQTRELIFSLPFKYNQIHNGMDHLYTGITRAMHYDHVHWAMEQGGLMEGMAGGGLKLRGSTKGQRKDTGLPHGYIVFVRRLIRRLQQGRFIFEDFSFPGMGRYGKQYNDIIANRFDRNVKNYDFGRDGTGRIVKELRSWLMADGGMMMAKRVIEPALSGLVDADTDRLSMIPVQSFDQGGLLRPGLTMAYNGTGSPERVVANGEQIMVIVPGLNETFIGEVHKMNRVHARRLTQRVRTKA